MKHIYFTTLPRWSKVAVTPAIMIFLIFVFSTSLKAQKGIKKMSTADFIESVKAYQDNSQPFEVSTSNASYVISDYTLNYIDENNFSLLSESGDVDFFTIVKSDLGFRGTLINKDQTKGYVISQDENGKVVFTETPISELIFTCNIEHGETTEEHVDSYRGFVGNSNTETDVYKLESNAGASTCLYLDFDGEPENPLTGWNYTYSVANFSDALIRKIWEHVAEDFVPFDVTVTTDRAVFDSYAVNERGWAAFADFSGASWAGVAYLNSFGSGRACLVDVSANPTESSYLWRTPSHELGHTLGLSHDGGGGDGAYYRGHGEYVPIMGTGSLKVSHWSNGEYSGADNTQDDFAIISGYLGYATDDHATSRDLLIDASNNVDPLLNNALIQSRNDVDSFKFVLAGSGNVNVTAQGGIQWPDLDIGLSLVDDQGNVIGSDSPVGSRTASLNENVSPGTYYLVVDGVGELTVSTGWSDYSSVGYFEITGTVTGSVPVTDDVSLVSISGLGSVCASQLVPEIEVENSGTNSVTSINVDVFVDNVLLRTEVVNVNLSSGQSGTFSLTPITQTGSHTIDIEIDLAGGIDQVSFNNDKTGSFTLKDGYEIVFASDLLNFDGSSPLSWVITEQGTGNNVVSSTDITVETGNPSEVSQSYCINQGCYEFDLSGNFDLCNQYPAFVQGGTYVTDDIVAHNGQVYKAKWWTQNAPPGQEWTNLGPCTPTATYFYSLDNTHETINYFMESSDDYSGSFNHSFCAGMSTGIVKTDINNIQIFPNPASSVFVVKSDQIIEVLKVRNTLGQVLISKYNLSDNSSIDISDLAPGSYFVEFSLDGNTTMKTLIVQ